MYRSGGASTGSWAFVKAMHASPHPSPSLSLRCAGLKSQYDDGAEGAGVRKCTHSFPACRRTCPRSMPPLTTGVFAALTSSWWASGDQLSAGVQQRIWTLCYELAAEVGETQVDSDAGAANSATQCRTCWGHRRVRAATRGLGQTDRQGAPLPQSPLHRALPPLSHHFAALTGTTVHVGMGA